MCSLREQLPRIIGIKPQLAMTNVRQKETIVSKVRGSRSTERLMYEPRDLECDLWQVSKKYLIVTRPLQGVALTRSPFLSSFRALSLIP